MESWESAAPHCVLSASPVGHFSCSWQPLSSVLASMPSERVLSRAAEPASEVGCLTGLVTVAGLCRLADQELDRERMVAASAAGAADDQSLDCVDHQLEAPQYPNLPVACVAGEVHAAAEE